MQNAKLQLKISKWTYGILVFLIVIAIGYAVYLKTGFLNKNSGAIQALATIILIIITAYYAWQTRKTVQEMNRQTNLQQMPILTISPHGNWACSFMLKNIGKGPALNIELRISQIHPKGGFTNLRNLAGDEQREFFNLGEGEEKSTISFCEIIDEYVKAQKPSFSYGVKGVFAVIATYEDINKNPYYTISLMKVRRERNDYILKTTKIGSYKSGKLEKVIPIDWLR